MTDKNKSNLEFYALKDGKTALMWAAMNGHANIVRLLLDNGAVVSLRDKVCFPTVYKDNDLQYMIHLVSQSKL
jgi:ankyrin repeat protein